MSLEPGFRRRLEALSVSARVLSQLERDRVLFAGQFRCLTAQQVMKWYGLSQEEAGRLRNAFNREDADEHDEQDKRFVQRHLSLATEQQLVTYYGFDGEEAHRMAAAFQEPQQNPFSGEEAHLMAAAHQEVRESHFSREELECLRSLAKDSNDATRLAFWNSVKESDPVRLPKVDMGVDIEHELRELGLWNDGEQVAEKEVKEVAAKNGLKRKVVEIVDVDEERNAPPPRSPLVPDEQWKKQHELWTAGELESLWSRAREATSANPASLAAFWQQAKERDPSFLPHRSALSICRKYRRAREKNEKEVIEVEDEDEDENERDESARQSEKWTQSEVQLLMTAAARAGRDSRGHIQWTKLRKAAPDALPKRSLFSIKAKYQWLAEDAERRAGLLDESSSSSSEAPYRWTETEVKSLLGAVAGAERASTGKISWRRTKEADATFLPKRSAVAIRNKHRHLVKKEKRTLERKRPREEPDLLDVMVELRPPTEEDSSF